MRAHDALLERLAQVRDLDRAAAVLGWDQQCFMPPGGAEARASQLATLRKLSHRILVAEETARLLEQAERDAAGLPEDSDERATLRVVRRDFDREAKLPARLVEALARETALGHEVWVRAREASDFAAFAPTLERILELTREMAGHLGGGSRPYDALLDLYEPGVGTAEVERVFAELRPGLAALVRETAARPPIDDSVLRRDYDEAAQGEACDWFARRLGYDFERGRQDPTVHPFCTSFGPGDVRITTRFDRNWLPCALMGTIHETGHALYEQGLSGDGPLDAAAGFGVHEGQSRLWENVVGRSRAFWTAFYPEVQRRFPAALRDVPLETFFRAVNRVQPSFIRVEADEVTYNLHILVRFELELALLDGRLAVRDAPAAWNAKMEEHLGIVPPDDAQGILQDVHWSSGSFGYFPTYTLGNLMAAQLYERAVEERPSIPEELARGETATLLGWLREKIHRPGRRWLPAELIRRATGRPLEAAPFLRHLDAKIRPLYGLA
jgi:carboxypeptidase Taq